MKKQLVIIGGGPAGLAAAVAAYDAGVRDMVILEREERAGGILKQCIHNGFGLTRFKESMTGPEYAQRFLDEVQKRGIEVRTNTFVTALSPEKQVTCRSEEGIFTYEADAVILAMGCRERSKGRSTSQASVPQGCTPRARRKSTSISSGIFPGRRSSFLARGTSGSSWRGA